MLWDLPSSKQPRLAQRNSQALQQSLKHLDAAYQKFFKSSGFPRFKSKRDKQSFKVPQHFVFKSLRKELIAGLKFLSS